MRPSYVKTLSVPTVGGDPSPIATAGENPTRVVVRNSGANILLIAYDSAQIQDLSNLGGTFELPAGASEVFVLAPGQQLFAASQGGSGAASISVSEAIVLKQTIMEA